MLRGGLAFDEVAAAHVTQAPSEARRPRCLAAAADADHDTEQQQDEFYNHFGATKGNEAWYVIECLAPVIASTRDSEPVGSALLAVADG